MSANPAYIILEGETAKALADKVNERAKGKHYLPLGGVAVSVTDDNVYYTQAMIKHTPDELVGSPKYKGTRG